MLKLLKVITLLTFLFIEVQKRILGVNVSLLEVLSGILFLFIIVDIIRSREPWRNAIKDKKLFISYLAYIVVLLIVIVYHNSNSIISIIKYLIVLLAGLVIFFDFYYQREENEGSYELYFLVLLIMASFIVFHGLFTVPDVLLGPKRFDSIFWGRSNRMASRLLLLIPSAYFLGKYKSNLYYILFYILVLGMIMTVSRGGILVLGIFILIHLKDFIKRENIGISFAGYSMCLLISYKFNYLQSLFYRSNALKEQIQQQAAGAAGDGVAGSISRILLWKHAVADFFSSPLFGIGIDQYRTYYMYYGEKVSEVNAHNWVLHLLAEVGIIGFAATLVLLIVFLKVFINKYNFYKSTNDLNSSVKLRIGLWTFILFLVHNLVEASANSLMFGYANVVILLIVLLGICLSGLNRAVDY